jgi:hypothetical protein
MDAEPIRRRDAQRAVELPLPPRKLALKRQCLFLYPYGMRKNGRAFVGEHEAVAGSLKQRLANRSLERAQASAHGRLAQAKFPGRGSKRAFTGDGEKDSQIAPFHLRHPRNPFIFEFLLLTFVSFQTVLVGPSNGSNRRGFP